MFRAVVYIHRYAGATSDTGLHVENECEMAESEYLLQFAFATLFTFAFPLLKRIRFECVRFSVHGQVEGRWINKVRQKFVHTIAHSPMQTLPLPIVTHQAQKCLILFLLLLYFRRRHTNPTILKKVLVLWNFSEKIKKWASIAFLWSIFFFHRYFRLCFFHFGSLHAQTLYWMRPTTASHIFVVRTEEHTLNAKRTNEQNKQKSFFTIQMKNSTSIYFQFLLLPGAAVAALSPSISSSCQLISFFVYVCVCVYVQCRQVVYILCWYSR